MFLRLRANESEAAANLTWGKGGRDVAIFASDLVGTVVGGDAALHIQTEQAPGVGHARCRRLVLVRMQRGSTKWSGDDGPRRSSGQGAL
jgi:hypothetical protein